MQKLRFGLVWLALVALVPAAAQAALIVNPAQPITHRLNVNIVQVADDSGSNAAPLFGDSTQQATIFSLVDTIWAQAGIDVNFQFRAGTYNSSFALTGNTSPRPDTDLDALLASAGLAGVTAADPLTLNLFMVRTVPGFEAQGNNTSNGLAILNGNGIAMWAGANLVTFAEGLEGLAVVLAHEIGHNLGLDHIVAAENLMQEGGASSPGERLGSLQIAAALQSPFTVPVPEPSSLALAIVGSVLLVVRRR